MSAAAPVAPKPSSPFVVALERLAGAAIKYGIDDLRYDDAWNRVMAEYTAARDAGKSL